MPIIRHKKHIGLAVCRTTDEIPCPQCKETGEAHCSDCNRCVSCCSEDDCWMDDDACDP